MCALSGLGAERTAEIVHTEYKMPVTYNKKGRRPVSLTGIIIILSSAVSEFDIMTDNGVGGDNFY